MATGAKKVIASSLLLTGCLLSGCEGDGSHEKDEKPRLTPAEKFAQRSAAEVEQAAETAMRSLESVYMELDILREGQRDSLKISMTADGDCVGTFIRDTAITKVSRHAGRAYFQPANAAAYTEFFGPDAAAVSEFVGGRWIIDDVGSTAPVCDLERYLDAQFESDVRPEVSDPEEFRGAPIVRIESLSGEILFVHAEEPHYVLHTDSELGHVEFSMFNREVRAKLPPTVGVVDLDDMPGSPFGEVA